MKLYIDIETRSALDLKEVGVYRYVEDPQFRILMAAWAIDDEPVQIETDSVHIDLIPGLWDPEVQKVAHNAAFERVCFSRFDGMPTGTYLDPEPWHDTAAIASERAYPASLDGAARVLSASPKDSAGTRLINLFCKPRRDGGWNNEHTHPEEWKAFMAYCRQDVVTLREIDEKLGDWPTETERLIFMADQRINDYGMRIDKRLARKAHLAALANAAKHEAEFRALTGVENPNSNPQLLAWRDREGLRPLLPNFRAETVEKALEQDLKPEHRKALELRQELALVAAKKFGSALACACEDDRLRGSFRFYGAHTGRWTGSRTQPHNLPRLGFKEIADEEIAIYDLLNGNGATPTDLKRLVRPMFLGPMTVVDYSSIEARVIAWLAGEQWVLEAARDGRDLYVETAKMMGGLTRAQGKVAVLALGYNGGPNSLRVMAGDADYFDKHGNLSSSGGTMKTSREAKSARGELIKHMSDEDLYTFFVYPWRNANRQTVKLWANLQDAFYEGGEAGPLLFVEKDGKDRAIRLPSGRFIVYHGVGRRHDPETGRTRLVFKDFSRGGAPRDTYGGRLTENVTQAVARDLMGEALVRLHDHGFNVVGHVHDEVLVDGEHDPEVIKKIMCELPSWATGLPVDGEGNVFARYRKG
jgi:DNA polymerase